MTPRIYKYWTAFRRVVLGSFGCAIILSAVHFPYHTDAPLSRSEIEVAKRYYTEAYARPASEDKTRSEYETEYLRVAQAAAKSYRIEEQVRAFVERFELRDRPVLEIGSGRGYLQDVAQNYTGLDISPSVARFYHKRFVVGSATALPFPDNSFEGVWSIWVFEHVQNPEQAFREARRVTRDQGVLFLLPAWNCTAWASDGYEVRPYSDLDWRGKVIKASIPLRSSPPFIAMSLVPTRIVRSFAAYFGPTKLRYRRLNPNYDKYWTNDSDAINSIDSHEAMLWFRSRGDECLNCKSASVLMAANDIPLIIRVHKDPGT